MEPGHPNQWHAKCVPFDPQAPHRMPCPWGVKQDGGVHPDLIFCRNFQILVGNNRISAGSPRHAPRRRRYRRIHGQDPQSRAHREQRNHRRSRYSRACAPISSAAVSSRDRSCRRSHARAHHAGISPARAPSAARRRRPGGAGEPARLARPASAADLRDITTRTARRARRSNLAVQYGDDAPEASVVSTHHVLQGRTPRASGRIAGTRGMEVRHREFHASLIARLRLAPRCCISAACSGISSTATVAPGALR